MTEVTPTIGAFLRTIYNLQEDQVPARRARVRERLGLAGPTVTQTVSRVVDAGLITIRDDQFIDFTDEGLRAATVAVRRHRLSERMLTDVLKLPAQQAHADANKWAHMISDSTERAIVESLDDPRFSPWGMPVPGLEEFGIEMPDAPEPVLLNQYGATAELGETVPAVVRWISEDAQEDADLAGALVGAGIVPGANVRIRADTDHYEVVGLSRYDLPEKKAHVLCLDIA